MGYRVSFKASADKAMDKLPKAIQAHIVEKAMPWVMIHARREV